MLIKENANKFRKNSILIKNTNTNINMIQAVGNIKFITT